MPNTDIKTDELRKLLDKVNAYLNSSGMDAVIAWSALMTYLKELKGKRRVKKNVK